MIRLHSRWLSPCLAALLGACVLAPEGLEDEEQELEQGGSAYVQPFAKRTLPELSTPPTWRELLQRAFLTNGELEAAWQDWRAAVARVTGESTWPNTDVELGFEYLFSSESMSAWDRTSLSVGFDPAEPLDWPHVTAVKGSVAFADARAAGERFRAAKFALQRRFLESWVELARLEEQAELESETLELLRTSAAAAERGAAIGSNSTMLVLTRIESAVLENAILGRRSAVKQATAHLRALANVSTDVAITAKSAWPMRDAPALADDEILALAAQSNPRLAELARSVEGRTDALELARAQWWPNVAPSAGLMGSISRFVGATLSLPLALPRIEAAIEEARAGVDRSHALARQGTADVNAAITAELLALREAERALAFLADTLVPLADQLSFAAGSAYAGGTVGQVEWLSAMRAVIDARSALLEARAAREASLARVEEWLGVDLGTLVNAPEVSHVR